MAGEEAPLQISMWDTTRVVAMGRDALPSLEPIRATARPALHMPKLCRYYNCYFSRDNTLICCLPQWASWQSDRRRPKG